MNNFAEWMEKNKEKAYAIAKANTRYNKDGHVIISKDDPWMQEECWDEDFRRLVEDKKRR